MAGWWLVVSLCNWWRGESRNKFVDCSTATARITQHNPMAWKWGEGGKGHGELMDLITATKYLHIYVEHRAVSGVFQTIDPPPPLHPASMSSHRNKGRGVHIRRAVRGWGSIFRKTPDIGLASCSIIPLRLHPPPYYECVF